MLLINLVNAADQLELFDNSGTFRKSQFSDSVANLQKENVRDSFEAPQELPEGWASILFILFSTNLRFSLCHSVGFFIFLGGVNLEMNQGLKSVGYN